MFNSRCPEAIGALGGAFRSDHAVNEHYTDQGHSATSSDSDHSFVYMHQQTACLITFGVTDSLTHGINDNGAIFGSAMTAISQPYAFIQKGWLAHQTECYD